MTDREQLQQQMAEIGNRYLKRTLGELPRMRELIAALHPGATDAIVELEHIAHRMHGSGAMFGFDAVSEQAHVIESIASQRALDETHAAELGRHLVALEGLVKEAARSRGIEHP